MADPQPSDAPALGDATYAVIRQRLQTQGAELRERMARLDARRQQVFGAIDYRLLQSDRITTAHNCVPRDLVPLGHGRFLFGFNVQLGLKREIELADVFAVYERDEATGTFKEGPFDALQDRTFLVDFRRLHQVYARATFSKFSLIEGSLYFVFQIGAGRHDTAVFKWIHDGGRLRYVDGRAEGEYRRVGFPPPHEFRWRTPDREAFRYGAHPHISIEERVFVECTGGTLTVKIEDNTATGEGIFDEPVEDRNQKVDDAEIGYALIGHLILLKVRPYKETVTRYLVFNEKQRTVVRIDSLGESCALLPEDHGLIFPDGYYLATGELKRFESRERDLRLERVVHAPNGEDSLYVFYHPASGDYALLPYRLIAQRVEERLVCHGFSLFPNGHLLLLRGDGEAQKHHTIQLRQTPFHQPGHEPPGQREAYLFQVGNKDVVRCLAECNEVLTLLARDPPYAALYTDLVKRCGAMLDAHPWLREADGFGIDATLRQVRETADRAVEEFEKVRRLEREAVQKVADVRRRAEEGFQALRRASFRTLDEYVRNLSALRQLRGELVTLREVRFVDVAALSAVEAAVAGHAGDLARACVQFLLQPIALDPYRQRAAGQLAAATRFATVAEGRKLEQAVGAAAGELELLIEVVNSLRIEDATEATRIIDGITAIYATLNQGKAALKKRIQDLAAAEGAAQFGAQLKLLGQTAASYLDLCETPARCDEYLNRISVQLEELEGRFADFAEYTVQLAEKRTALYEAFEQRKLALVEQRNRRAAALLAAAERVLKTIQNRLAGFQSVDEINTYLASDLMAAKVRESIGQLLALGDSVKADDLQGRLKSVQQEAVRQLKDRQELFVDGTAVIQLGRHRFNVNTQPLDLTIVPRDGVPHLHLTGTRFFEPIEDEAFLATRAAGEQEVVSENAEVYRAEFLAARLLAEVATREGVAAAAALPADEQLTRVQEFAAARYDEGYTKGVHDCDAARIFRALATTQAALELARYQPDARACAQVFWARFCAPEHRARWSATLLGFSARNRAFPGDAAQPGYIAALQGLIADFLARTQLYPAGLAAAAGEYLFFELSGSDTFAISREADELAMTLRRHLANQGGESELAQARAALAALPANELELVRDWVRGFLLPQPAAARWREEVAAILFCGDALPRRVIATATTQTLTGLQGAHAVIRDGTYAFDYHVFTGKLARYEAEVVPRFTRHQQAKQGLLERERARLRLDEFKARVLPSFVRNQLIDEVYLTLVGDNLAKQIGAAGAAKRTDLMGLLLLISPPGYGKTTLLEYLASRLGLVFVKINGPALGHAVTSLDPEQAPNAAARHELHRLNLAFEMGDNVMLCVDDIQHCHAEFLQKFISLCDGQRKIEGVWRGRPRTYDLRGRKVVVVMAGNPYTESGQKFKLPDMLANRADTYNLGDIIGGSAEWFKASYLENAVTSNAILAPLAHRSQRDIRLFIRLAGTGERTLDGLEGSYSASEVEEILAVLGRLIAIREIVLRVNLEYIASAAQADEFRTEPPFRLQGSYRNMNRLAEKVVALMNAAEVQTLVLDHYRGEAQTLTTGAEANFLKFKELLGAQTPAEQARWEEIKKTFRRHQLVRGSEGDDPVSRVVGQLTAFQAGLQAIQETLEKHLARPAAPLHLDLSPLGQGIEALRATVAERLPARGSPATPADDDTRDALATQHGTGIKALGEELSRALAAAHAPAMTQKVDGLAHELESIHRTLASMQQLATQRLEHLRQTQERLATRLKEGTAAAELTHEMLANERAFLENFGATFTYPQARPSPPRPARPEPDAS